MRRKSREPVLHGIGAEIAALYNQQTEQYHGERGDITRIKSLRPSQLPFCPVGFFINVAKHGATRTMDMRGHFYTRIGTAVHEVVQTFLATSGKFLADWHCRQCGKWKRLSMDHECCDFQMDYHEVTINHKGVVGHIDAIYRDGRGRYWIVDFKTTSVKSAPLKIREPGVAYIEQVETYACYLRMQYKIKVHGIMLFFIKRDNPKAPVVWQRRMRDIDYDRVLARTRRYMAMHKEAMAVTTLKEALALARYGKCESKYCRVCQTTLTHREQLVQAFKRGKSVNRFPIRDLQ